MKRRGGNQSLIGMASITTQGQRLHVTERPVHGLKSVWIDCILLQNLQPQFISAFVKLPYRNEATLICQNASLQSKGPHPEDDESEPYVQE